MLLLRLVERPMFGQSRPWTPFFTQAVCRCALIILGIGVRREGQPICAASGVVANHSSWLDIFVLNAAQRVYFVAKAEVSAWPGIGLLARATGTVFVQRRARDARRQNDVMQNRLSAGQRLCFFPESTSSDGQRVLPFKSTLFEAFLRDERRLDTAIQPVSIAYSPPAGEDIRFYGWWGDMVFAPHLLKVLAVAKQGLVQIRYHPPLRVGDFPDRKALAAACEAAVRSV